MRKLHSILLLTAFGMVAGAFALGQDNGDTGPVKAGGGRVFDLVKMKPYNIGPEVTEGAMATVVEGERMNIGLIRVPAGGIIVSHHHPNEEWLYILEGAVRMDIGGKQYTAEAGSAIYVPSNIVHGAKAGADRELVFFVAKDSSWGMVGIKAED